MAVLDCREHEIRTPCTLYDGDGVQIDPENKLQIVRVDTETGLCEIYQSENGFPQYADGEMLTYQMYFKAPIRVIDATGYEYK